MSATHSRSGAAAVKLRSNQVRRLAATIPDRRGDEPASAYAGKPGSCHQSRDPLAADAKTLGGKLGVMRGAP